MKTLSFSGYLLTACLICAPTKGTAQSTALHVNDALTAITDTLAVRGQNWVNAFAVAYKSKSWGELKPHREAIERFVSASIIQVKTMKDVSNSKELRLAMISFLEFEKAMIGKAFIPLESLTADGSAELTNAAFENLKRQSAGESAALARVVTAQAAYARSNGFQIDSPTTED